MLLAMLTLEQIAGPNGEVRKQAVIHASCSPIMIVSSIAPLTEKVTRGAPVDAPSIIFALILSSAMGSNAKLAWSISGLRTHQYSCPQWMFKSQACLWHWQERNLGRLAEKVWSITHIVPD